MLTDEEFASALAALEARIVREDYYHHLYIQCVERCSRGASTLTEVSKRQAIQALNMFWMALPDSKLIRRGPFFDLCDLAEEIFED